MFSDGLAGVHRRRHRLGSRAAGATSAVIPREAPEGVSGRGGIDAAAESPRAARRDGGGVDVDPRDAPRLRRRLHRKHAVALVARLGVLPERFASTSTRRGSTRFPDFRKTMRASRRREMKARPPRDALDLRPPSFAAAAAALRTPRLERCPRPRPAPSRAATTLLRRGRCVSVVRAQDMGRRAGLGERLEVIAGQTDARAPRG